MNELLLYAFVATPWVLAVVIPLGALFALVVGRRSAPWWVASYFVLLFFMPNASFGLADPSDSRNFYSRATGTFYFSAINVMLFGLALQSFFARRMGLPLPVAHNLKLPAIAFGLILLGNLVIGFASPDLRWFQIVGYSGLLNVFNFMLVLYVLFAAFREPRDLERLIDLLLVCVVLRGLWGLVRFVALGGDPANFYANFQDINVKLTFFDINDSLLACIALFIAAWRLARGLCRTAASRWLHAGIVLLELFIILFSYRRTAWGGLALAALYFAFLQRPRLRWSLLATYVVAGVPLLIYKMIQRAGERGSSGSLLERMLPDVMTGGSMAFATGRFAELYAAWLGILQSPWWGLGSWGQYSGFRFSDLAWHRGDFSWMHSGVMHIMLKTGLMGLAVVVLLFWLFGRHAHANRAVPESRTQAAYHAGVAGVLFMVPSMLIGTPVIEFRTMQLLGLCVSLPYLALAADRATRRAVASQGGPHRPRRRVFVARPFWA